MEVHLRAARIPIIGAIAHHYWLVVAGGGEPVRWEIWQWQNAGGEAWGHLHRNLMEHDRGVGNGPSWIVGTWRGEAAETLAHRLAEAPETYPWRHRYLPWPGPNSNTFAGWAVGDVRVLGWQALGKRYPLWPLGPMPPRAVTRPPERDR